MSQQVAKQQHTQKQRSLRNQVKGQELDAAVAFAVRAMFRFTHRAKEGKALWSDSHVVWLGRSTFLHWCLDDSEIDIPWIVAGSMKAPTNRTRLRERVEELVLEYFTESLSKLPRRSTGSWLPLP